MIQLGRGVGRVPAGLLVLIAAAAVAGGGCSAMSGDEPPHAAPGTAPSGAPATASSDSTATSTPAPHSVANLCALVTPREAAELARMSEPEAGYSFVDGHPLCTWHAGDAGLTIGWTQDGSTAGVATGPTITITPIQIQGPAGVQKLDTGATVMCSVLVDTPDGLVGSTVSLHWDGEGRYDECQLATEATTLAISKLSEGW